MTWPKLDRWLPALALTGAGLTLVIMGLIDGTLTSTVISLLVLGVAGWWMWPGRTGPHVSHADAQRAAGDQGVIVYWRPG